MIKPLSQTIFHLDSFAITKKEKDISTEAQDTFSRNHDPPRNLHIAMMGDSLTRYMYMSLAYYLHTGLWELDPKVNQKDTANSVKGFDRYIHTYYKTFDGMDKFLRKTNDFLAPFEICDCITMLDRRKNETRYSRSFENRYYWNPETNNSLVYIQAMGNYEPSKGHYNPKEIINRKQTFPEPNIPEIWSSDWADTIQQHIAHLDPKPEFLVLNAGHWDNDFDSTPFAIEVKHAAESSGMKAIWRTTTSNRNHFFGGDREGSSKNLKNHMVDELMCSLLDFCVDVSWTKECESEEYFDGLHFKNESIYQRMNEQLLEAINSVHRKNDQNMKK